MMSESFVDGWPTVEGHEQIRRESIYIVPIIFSYTITKISIAYFSFRDYATIDATTYIDHEDMEYLTVDC